MDASEARRVIEAILFISDEPVALKKMKDVLPEFDQASLKDMIDSLNEEYRAHQHSFKIQEIAGGFQLVTDAALASWIKRALQVPRDPLVSKAALETIAVIAYRQPVTKAEIEAIRGVDVSGTLDTLLERQFIKIAGRKDSPGRPLLYSTTSEFLAHFGLKNLGDLPPMPDDASPSLEPLVKGTQSQTGMLAKVDTGLDAVPKEPVLQEQPVSSENKEAEFATKDEPTNEGQESDQTQSPAQQN